MQTLINLTAFKVSWVSSVAGAAAGWPIVGPLCVAGAAALHLRRSRLPRRELALLATVGVLGFAFDSLLLSTGWISFPGHTGNLAPYWMVGIWVLFATTLNVAFRWMRPRLPLAALLGGISGPLSYWSGSKTGALTLAEPTSALIALSIGWALVMPLLIVLAGRLDGISEPQADNNPAPTPAPSLTGEKAHV
jgi:hypothetical protein